MDWTAPAPSAQSAPREWRSSRSTRQARSRRSIEPASEIPPLCGVSIDGNGRDASKVAELEVTRQASNLLVESCFCVAIELLRYEVLDLSCGYRRERPHNDGAAPSAERIESPADYSSARCRSAGVCAVVRRARRRFARTSRSEARPLVRVAGHADGGPRAEAARD